MIGTITDKHQDWFVEIDADIQVLLEEQHHLHRALLINPAYTYKKVAYSNIRGMVQRELCQMQDTWLSKNANVIQLYVDCKGMKKKTLQCSEDYLWSNHIRISPLLSADGNTLITDKKKILEHWVEHFCSVLN